MDQFGKCVGKQFLRHIFFCFQAQVTNLAFDPTFHKYVPGQDPVKT